MLTHVKAAPVCRHARVICHLPGQEQAWHIVRMAALVYVEFEARGQ